jgi:hypothetical protein
MRLAQGCGLVRSQGLPDHRIYRWDPDLEPFEGDMEFRLTYAGQLLAARNDKRVLERSLHVHRLRRHFHAQLRELWRVHPVLVKDNEAYMGLAAGHEPIFQSEGFNWKPIVTKGNGLICKLDVLLLRQGNPGNVLYDIDNKLKTLFDALRMPIGPQELGEGTSQGKQLPQSDENPFYVLLENDNLITHVAVTSDRLLEPVPGVPIEEAVRLVLDVTVRPYDVHMDNLAFT